MTKREAGSKGGRTTFKRYGRDHMAKIGREGAMALYRKYRLIPWKTSGWALIDKVTGEVRATW